MRHESRPDSAWMSGRSTLPARQDSPRNDSGAGVPDLGQLGARIRRQLGTILVGAGTVLVVAAVATYFWPRTYVSSATILVEQQTTALDVLEGLGPTSQIGTEIELIRSRRVIETVVDREDLNVTVSAGKRELRPAEVFVGFDATREARPGRYRILDMHERRSDALDDRGGGRFRILDERTGAILGQVSPGERVSFHGLTFALPEGDVPEEVFIATIPFPEAVTRVANRISVTQVHRDADLVALECEAPTAIDAHRLCHAISHSYLELRTELQRTEATATVVFLRDQAARVGEQLAKAEEELEAYARENDVVGLEQRASEEVRHLAELRAQREQLEVERTALVRFVEAVENQESDLRRYRDLGSFTMLLQNRAFTQLLVEVVELEGKRSDLAARMTDTHPQIIALDTRISQIFGQLRDIASSHEQALLAQIHSLDATLHETDARIRVIPSQQVQVARLERQSALLDDLYRLLETRLQEAQVAEAIDLPSVDIVDAASFPLAPSSPKLALNLVLGLALGLVYGGLLASYRELSDQRVHDSREIERRTGLPVLCQIPRLRSPGAVMTALFPADAVNQSDVASLHPGRTSSTGLQRAPCRPLGPILLDSREAFATQRRTKLPAPMTREKDQLMALESFHSLAADLRFAGQRLGRENQRSISVTSASRGEGKTFTACNLALVCAAHGSRTLLIDADMRAGSVADFFSLPSDTLGLSDALSSGANARDEWRGMRVNDSEFWVIPAGTPTPHSSSLLESPGMALLLARAESDFDQIIIDTPPLSVITDAATLASLVDSTILVARNGVTQCDLLDLVLERLARANAGVLGIVLNGADLTSQYPNLYDLTSEAS